MPIRIEFTIKCEICQANFDEPFSLIYNLVKSERQFNQMSNDSIMQKVFDFYSKDPFICPGCDANNHFSTTFVGAEYFEGEAKVSFLKSMFNEMQTFYECILLSENFCDQLQLEDRLCLRLQSQGSDFKLLAAIKDPIITGYKYWEFVGVSKNLCLRNESKSYNKPYIKFLEKNHSKGVLLVEWYLFPSLLRTEMFCSPKTFSKKNLSKIKGLKSLMQIHNIPLFGEPSFGDAG